MAKDDPRELLTLANRLRTHADEYDGPDENVRNVLRALAVFICPPDAPEPEPKFPPGELVIVAEDVLQITCNEGLCWLTDGTAADPACPIERIATEADVRQWAGEYGHSNFLTLQRYARLVVSQEKPPELKGDDKENYMVIEKRRAINGDFYVSVRGGQVLQWNLNEPTALPVWIVKSKE